MTEEAYLGQLLALLPEGAAWPRELDTDQVRLLSGLAVEFARIDARAADLLRESSPRQAVEMLPDWEELYQITPAPGASIEERQQLVWAKHWAKGDIKKPYFKALAGSMGYTIHIHDYAESMADFHFADDELLEDGWEYLTAGVGMAGDTLAYEDVVLPWIWEVVVASVPAYPPTPDLETVLRDIKPGHILLNFTYL